MFPPTPALRSLRLARLSDLTRIGVVAAAGFYHSSWWGYDRPFADKFVNDTLASYRHMYQSCIIDPSVIVLVAEDDLNKSEAEAVYGALADAYPPWSAQIPPESLQDGKAIVGIASLSLQAGSARHGQFQPDGTPEIAPDPALRNRDKNPVAGKLMQNATHQVAEKLFAGRMVVDTMVVHPAYWRRGHATNLTQWQMELADGDSVGLGVEAAKMGVLLFEHLGFKEAQTVQVPGYEDHPDPVAVWFGLRDETKAAAQFNVQL
ncbi:hypothetical protein LTR53_005169 [Teratosphaeriaceae sp. CCFEE 6253]|nr:hypothetical protein LTR53_005169 [Teratosphaeriaceae sp. CCFEE 6253]